jgi:hypothetical protein
MSSSILTLPVWTCVSAAAAAASTVLTAMIFMATRVTTSRYQKADFYIKITDRYNSRTMVEALREIVLFYNTNQDEFAEIFGAEHAKQTDAGIKLNNARGIVVQYFEQVADMYQNRLIDVRLARMLCNFYGLNVYYQIVVPMGWARTDVSHAHDVAIVEALKRLKPQYGDGKIGGAP